MFPTNILGDARSGGWGTGSVRMLLNQSLQVDGTQTLWFVWVFFFAVKLTLRYSESRQVLRA